MAEWYENLEVTAEDVVSADNLANRLSDSGGYVGRFTKVWPVVFPNKGTRAVKLEFQLEGFTGEVGKTETVLFMESADGKKFSGSHFFSALSFLCGVKGKPKPSAGKIPDWDNGKKVEVDGVRFPELEGKLVGVIFQQELMDKRDNYHIQGFYDSRTRLTAAEIQKGVTRPEKLAVALKNLKPKDSRTNKGAPTKPDVFGSSDGDDSVM